MKVTHYRTLLALAGSLLPLAAGSVLAAERERRIESPAKDPAVRAAPAGRDAREARETKSEPARNLDYILQPQDVLRVFVFQHDDLNKQTEAVSISQEHTISLPLIGIMNLQGKTVRQAEALIREAYDKDYLVKPQVSVIVTKYAERSVNVVGQVNNAGRVPFPQERGLTVVEAIALAGGQTRLADLKKVKITRKRENGETVVEEIDVDALMKKGGRGAFPLEKDDVIFVPERIL